MRDDDTMEWGSRELRPVRFADKIKTENGLGVALAKPGNWSQVSRLLHLDLEEPTLNQRINRTDVDLLAKIRGTDRWLAIELTIRPVDIDHARKAWWYTALPGIETAVLVAPDGCFERLTSELQDLDANGKPRVEVLSVSLGQQADGKYLLDVKRHSGGVTEPEAATSDPPPLPTKKLGKLSSNGDAKAAMIRSRLRQALIDAGLMRDAGGRHSATTLVGKMGFGAKGANLTCAYSGGTVTLTIEVKTATVVRFGEAAMTQIEAEATEEVKLSKSGTRSIVVLRCTLPLSADSRELQRACHTLCSRTNEIQTLRQNLVIAGDVSGEVEKLESDGEESGSP